MNYGIFYKSENDGQEYILGTPQGLTHTSTQADEKISSFDSSGTHPEGTFYKKEVNEVNEESMLEG